MGWHSAMRFRAPLRFEIADVVGLVSTDPNRRFLTGRPLYELQIDRVSID